jgi:hypothetical protein
MGYTPSEDAHQLNPCPRCFNTGKVMREGAKDRYILGVAFRLCEDGLEARHINFSKIEKLWEEGVEFATAARHFLLENQVSIPHNHGIRSLISEAKDGPLPEEPAR